MMEADPLEALHGAEHVQTLGDILGSQANIFQLHGLQRFQIGDVGGINIHSLRKQPPNPFPHSILGAGDPFLSGFWRYNTAVMDGVLFTPLEAGLANADLAALVARLLAEVDQLRAEVATLRRENLELRQEAGYWQSRHADAVRRIAALEQENELLRGENRKLQAERFGRRSEKQSGSDRSNDLDDPTQAKPKRQRGRQPDQRAPQRRDASVFVGKFSHATGANPISALPSAAITATCPLVSSSLTCRKLNRFARIVACR
jgi:hypothetical protein